MSSVKFFPIRWFEDSKWKSIQVVGRLENGRSVYLRIGFKPYFTIKYPDEVLMENITETHRYLLNETPVHNITKLDIPESQVYRIYLKSRDDYNNAIDFFEQNRIAKILDKTQSIKSKFFSERQINPGAWQMATNLNTLLANLTYNAKYSTAELEYFTNEIRSVEGMVGRSPAINAFYDIEAAPSDDVSFPDADANQPPDSIFAISLVIGRRTDQTENIIYIVSGQELKSEYMTDPSRTEVPYKVKVVSVDSEKSLLETFFQGLVEANPDRLISMNGRRFDLNYIGARSRALGVKIPNFTKVLSYRPYFYQKTIYQEFPFPQSEKVWHMDMPGISQIDYLDFYRRLYPQLGSHRLDVLGNLILGKGKTGLGVQEMFQRYRRGTKEDYQVIIDYSIVDSILLFELWEASQIGPQLSIMANFWKGDSEDVISTTKRKLFDDLLRYITPNPPDKQFTVGKPPQTERTPGIHRHVYIYSLSEVYLDFLTQLNDPLTKYISDYFRGSHDGIIPFGSGYFQTNFDRVQDYMADQTNESTLVWIEPSSFAAAGSEMNGGAELNRGMDRGMEGDTGEKGRPQKVGPYPSFSFIDYIPLIVVVNKSWIIVNSSGVVFKKGLSPAVRPPFKLIQKYVDYILDQLIEESDEEIEFPEIPTEFNDFVLEMKVSSDDFSKTDLPKVKDQIIQQLRELGMPVRTSWRKVKYIQTDRGPIIEEIYSQDFESYMSRIDVDWYNEKLNRVIQSIFN